MHDPNVGGFKIKPLALLRHERRVGAGLFLWLVVWVVVLFGWWCFFGGGGGFGFMFLDGLLLLYA